MTETRLECRARAAWTIGRRGFRAALMSPGPYLVTFLGCLGAAALISLYTGAVEEEGLQVMNDPLNMPLFLMVVLNAVYLAVAASISISREQDLGTLEVLFHGPVDCASFIAAKYLEQMLAFAAMAVFYFLEFITLGLAANLGLTWRILLGIMLAFGVASAIISFGILVSALTRKTRTSILALLGIMALFLGVQWAGSYLAATGDMGALTSAAAQILAPISPFSYMIWGMRAIALRNYGSYSWNLASSVIYTAVMLALAMSVFGRKGVRS